MNLGVYVQVPFCQTKCTYCNFHTGVVSTQLYSPFAEAVCSEIRNHARYLANAGIEACEFGDVDTVYVGGGTPSLLEPAALTQILNATIETFPCELREVTLEADPETITVEKVKAWFSAGFDRISLGTQSFQDTELRAAGRMHRKIDIYNAVRFLRDAGIQNISFDFIAGLPHQTMDSWRDSLVQALALRPEHISIYLMEIDEGSRLGKEVLTGGTRYSAAALPDDDTMASMYEFACASLQDAGYEHYEISNWALPGFRSKHNLKYWRREPYLGFGAGAHSFNGKQRWAHAHDPMVYVSSVQQGRIPIEQLELVSSGQALDEELFLGLRQLEGINVARIEALYNVSLRPRLEPLQASGMLELEGKIARLAPSRLAISNEVFMELLS